MSRKVGGVGKCNGNKGMQRMMQSLLQGTDCAKKKKKKNKEDGANNVQAEEILQQLMQMFKQAMQQIQTQDGGQVDSTKTA